MSELLKTTQVVLTTSNYLPGSTNNDAKYLIDWSAILKPNTPYKVHFTYIGGLNTYTGNRQALVSFDFNTAVYQATSNVGAVNSNIVGFLTPVIVQPASQTVYLVAQTNTNEPVYMERRPLNTLFNVKIVDINGNLWVDNNATPAVPANWVLTIHFTEANRE